MLDSNNLSSIQVFVECYYFLKKNIRSSEERLVRCLEQTPVSKRMGSMSAWTEQILALQVLEIPTTILMVIVPNEVRPIFWQLKIIFRICKMVELFGSIAMKYCNACPGSGDGINVVGLISLLVFYAAVLCIGIWAGWKQRRDSKTAGTSNNQVSI